MATILGNPRQSTTNLWGEMHMLGPANALQTTMDLSAPDRVALRPRVVVPRRPVATAASLALLLLLGLTLVQSLAGSRPSLRAGVRSEARSREGLSSLPLVAQGVISGALGKEDGAYRVSSSAGGFQATNHAQRLRAQFSSSGVSIDSGAVQLGLSLRAVGYGAALTAVGNVMPRARANRVVYSRAGLSEWYANGPLGLEQGFTIPRAPAGHEVGPLTLAMGLSGNAHASLAGDVQSLTLSHAGGPSLRYGGLVASEASGRALHSWLVLVGGRLLLRVDTHGARFPLRIDPLVEQAKLIGEGEVKAGQLGYSVALSANGNTALVGADFDDEVGGASVGSAFVFTRSEGKWTQQGPKLTGTGEERNRYFGTSVALSGDGNTALVGGHGENEGEGRVWIFTRSEGKWTQQGEPLAGGEEIHKESDIGFGVSVGLSYEGNTALIGGPGDDEGIGAVWAFTRSEGKWTQQAKITGGEETGKAGFGNSVALNSEGNTVLIGGEDDNAFKGAVWVFTRSEGKWTQQGPKITAETGDDPEVHPLTTEESGEGLFGSSVALSYQGGNTALIGGYADSGNKGAAWVFTRSEGKWTQQGSKLTGSEEVDEAEFGRSVALSGNGNTALIGGPYDGGFVELDGAAWEFTRSGTTWTQERPKLSRGVGNEFGYSVALASEGSTALIGGPYHEVEGDVGVGAAWVFTYSLYPEEGYGLENEGEPDQKQCFSGYPVNCATGNQVETQTDMAVGGRGPGLHVTRTYNSQLAVKQDEHKEHGAFGYGWTGPYSANLAINEELETATVYQDNGSSVTFDFTSSKTYVGADGLVQATLVKEGTSYIYTLPDQTKLDFNSAGQVTSETDRNGNVITLAYNSKKQLESATDGAGRKLTFTYNGEGLVESVKDPMGHAVKYAYELGNLISVTQPGETSLRWQFKYNSEHEMTSETDGRKNTVTTEYNSAHQAVSQTDPMERTRKWKYAETESGPETTITEPNTSVTLDKFNSADLPTSVTHAYGTSLAATTTYEYDASDDLVAVTDPNKHTTTYGYDSTGDRTSEKNADGDETKWTYDSTHDIATTTTPGGEKTTIKRESHGNPEVIERPAPGSKTQKTTYKYDADGDVESMTNPLEQTWKYEYDSYGDRKAETDPEGHKRTWEYNEDSQETSEVSPRGNAEGAKASEFTTKTERNAQGRALKITDPLGHTTKYTYDGNGNVETVTDGNSHTTKYTYDADNELTKTEAPNKAVTETEYDPMGQVKSQTDGNKHVTKYVRNALEEVEEVVNPPGKKTLKEYNAAGILVKLTDPAKRMTTYKYDPANRLEEVSYSSGKPATIKYEYNKDGYRTKMTDGTGTTTYTFDQLDRMTASENGHKEIVKYEYNLGNQQTKITYPNTKVVERAYDKDGRLEKVTDWNKNATTFKYSADSQLEKLVFPAASKDEDTYSYNDADQMSEVKLDKSTEVLASLAYTRDNDGQVKTTTTKGLPGTESVENTYDENNRLTKFGTTEYKYDAANNPTTEGSSTNTFNEGDELEKGTGETYTYDELGERTKTTPGTGPATTYGYDQASNLLSVERPKEGATAEIKDTYAYNGENLRTSQTISGTTTYLAWDMAEELPLLLSDTTNSYIYGPGGLPIEQISSGGTVSYLHHDQAGSTRLLTGSTGTVTGKCTYSAYGTPTCEGTTTTPLGYDAQYTSSDTGLIYLRGRTYDPTTAQFLSVDPLVKTTRAPYTYAGDDPTTQADPTGLESLCEIYNGLLSPEPGTHIESKAEKQEVEREERAATKEQEKNELEERALNNKLAKELAEIRAKGRRALEADKHSEESSLIEEVITKGVKAIGGCSAGSDVGTVIGGEVGFGVGGPAGFLAGVGVGAPAGCVVGGVAAGLAPVNPLQPSEGGP